MGELPSPPRQLLAAAQLRRLVAQLKGCLPSLPARQTRVLALRTGLGRKHAYTRRQVARILRVSLKQEGRIERRAMTGLVQAAAQGRCGNPLTSIQTTVLQTVSRLLGLAHPALAADAGPSVGAPSGSGASATHSATTSHGGAGSGSQPSQQPVPASPGGSAAVSAPTQGSGFNWPLILLAIVTALGLTSLWLVAGRMRTQPEEAAAAAHSRRLAVAAEQLRSRAQRVRTGARGLAGAVNPRQARRGAEAVAGAVGLVALRGAVSDRRRARRGATRGHGAPRHLDAPPAAARQPHDHRPANVPAASTESNGGSAAAAPAIAATAGAATAAGVEPFELGGALAEKGDMTGAEAAYRRADEHGHPSAPSNLGVLLEHRGDLAGAEAAYRRADQRGDATGAFNLAGMLAERNDLAGAEAALRRADERGDAASASSLARLLEHRGDIRGAEAAYRRADERGDAAAPSNLGMLLEQRDDLAGAEAAYRRADERGDATGAFKLGALLERRNDLRAAEAAYERASERGSGYVAELAGAALSLLRARR